MNEWTDSVGGTKCWELMNSLYAGVGVRTLSHNRRDQMQIPIHNGIMLKNLPREPANNKLMTRNNF